MNIVIANTEIRQDAEGRYCLNDLHKASGGEKRHGPSYWLANAQTKELLAELGGAGIPVGPVATLNDGRNNGTYVCKELVYAYAMWISAAFHLKVIRAYDAMVSNMQIAVASSKFYSQIPQTLPEALRLAAVEMEKNEKLALENKVQAEALNEQAPKVAFARQVEVAPDAIDVCKAAQLLGTGRNRLMQFLREKHWVTRYNQPYQDKIDAGLLNTKIGRPYEHPERGLQQSVTTLVTGKGLVKLRQLWDERQKAISDAWMLSKSANNQEVRHAR